MATRRAIAHVMLPPYRRSVRLITVPFSHYCEKARWALDRARLPYVEAPHLPLLHWAATFGAGGGRTVPVLTTEDEVVADSTDIIRWADRRAAAADRLVPDDARTRGACDALEDELDETFGPAVRRIGYSYAFAHDPLMRALLTRTGAPRWQLATSRFTYPLARAYMTRALAINEHTVAASYDVVRRTFDRVADMLRDGRRYLLGDRMSAADLTFAALAAPMVGPAEHPFPVPAEHAPEAVQAGWREFRAHRAGAFVLRLYADHRR